MERDPPGGVDVTRVLSVGRGRQPTARVTSGRSHVS